MSREKKSSAFLWGHATNLPYCWIVQTHIINFILLVRPTIWYEMEIAGAQIRIKRQDIMERTDSTKQLKTRRNFEKMYL